jgi:hypothetical protein
MLIRFFLDMVYIDLNRHDTLSYEWPLAQSCHLVICVVVLMAWIRG